MYMKKTIAIIGLTSLAGLFAIRSQSNQLKSQPLATTQNVDSIKEENNLFNIEKLYEEISLKGKLKFEAFEMAMNGYQNMSFRNKDIISVIDFSLPSTDKRMVVIDLKNKKVLFHTIVSHGRNSGEKYATSFSNRHGSYQSSLGFYKTANTYQGGNGYSLVLDGLEKGINDQAKPRAVVIHGAAYSSQAVIDATGRLGRSYGCPALPRELNTPIINTIKDGTMLFIYADNKEYLAQTKVFKKAPTTLIAQKDFSETGTTQGALN